ncbi:response regulator [Fimbriiglobus ruber]|uniref:Two-component system response regulator n=1 Tax=Fimbriiglobus ruber TaxID=1908690 RepID=A0A225DQQ3_9BACT|nr:response regulator [Fimbriiglobus ruber]OWK38695.1 Two-component system response regulator [Fimbriiglobus ruber]
MTRSVLLVEDSDADSEATIRALGKCATPPAVHRCADGDEALAYLRQRAGAAEDGGHPSVVLLDLNMPGTDGRDVLEQIKADDQLKHIPVVIMTTSADRTDVTFCYRHGASGFMTKPLDLEQFAAAVRDFHAYWFRAVVLPDAGGREGC